MARHKEVLSTAFCLFLVLGTVSCTRSAAPNKYVNAEKLWTQKKYAAAAVAFDEVSKAEPNGAFGIQALYRSAMTKTLFLSKHQEAIQQFKLVIERAPNSEIGILSIIEVGEIYFNRLNSCSDAITWYLQYEQNNQILQNEKLVFLQRRARCHHRLRELAQARQAYEKLIEIDSKSEIGLKSRQELGLVYLSMGEKDIKFSELAMQTFNALIKDLSDPEAYTEAQFGLASSLQQLGKLQEALTIFEGLLDKTKSEERSYLLKVNIARLKERMSKKQGITEDDR